MFEDWRDESYWWEYGDKCEGCGCRYPELQRDHKVPRSKGGTDDPSNIQMLCPNCHWLKSQEERHSFRFKMTADAVKRSADNRRGKKRKGPPSKGFSGRTHTEETKKKQREGTIRYNKTRPGTDYYFNELQAKIDEIERKLRGEDDVRNQ